MTAEEKACSEFADREYPGTSSIQAVRYMACKVGWNAHAAWVKAAASSGGEAGKFPRRIWIGESCDEWGLSPGSLCPGEPYISLEEHEALLLAGRASLREEIDRARLDIKSLEDEVARLKIMARLK